MSALTLMHVRAHGADEMEAVEIIEQIKITNPTTHLAVIVSNYDGAKMHMTYITAEFGQDSLFDGLTKN